MPRKTRKKAISPIIAIIILLLITIAIAGAGYSYFSVYWESTTGQNLAFVDAYPTGNEANLIVRNTGTQGITLDEVKILDSSGQEVSGTWTTPEGQPITQLEPGKLAKFNTTCTGFCEYMISSGGGISMPIPMEIKCTDSDWIDGTCVLECKPGQLIGDVNGDGEVTNEDVDLTAKVAVGLILIPKNLCCIDLTENGAVTGMDAASIARIAEGLNESPGYCSRVCTDSDGGINYYTQGTAQNSTDNGTDSCSGDVLTEYSCAGDSVVQAGYDCSLGGMVCQAGSCIPFPTDYVSYWKFDGDAIDSGPGGNDGTFEDNATTIYDSARNYSGETNGYILSLDEVGDYVDCGNDSSLNVDYITVALWFKVDGFTNNGGLLAKGDNSNRQYWIWIYDNNLSMEIDEGINYNYLYSLQTDIWYHLTVTYNGSNIITHINGTEINNITQSTGPILTDNNPLLIGRLPGYNNLNGTIDDVMIYNRSLSVTEIREIYCGQGGTAAFC